MSDNSDRLTQDDFTPEFCAALMAEYGLIEIAAAAIAPKCERMPGTVKQWISKYVGPRRVAMSREVARAANPGIGMDLSRPNDPNRLNRIDDLLDRANVPIEAIGAIRSTKLKAYGGFHKGLDADGKPIAIRVPMYSTTIDILPPDPEFPVLQPAPPKQITFRPAPRILRKTRVAVVYSDAQIGFLRDAESDQLEEIHDPRALDLAEQITADVSPDEQDWIGDWMDWTELSRWPKHPEMRRCLQPSIDAGSEWLARLRAAARRKTKAVMIGSNHGDRPELSMLAYNMEAVGIKRAARLRRPNEWPVHSEGFLLGYNELGIEFSGRFPGGEYFLTPDLVLIHAPPKRLEFEASVIHGHTHKLTRTTDVTHGHNVRNTYFVYDIGCMCQLGATTNARRLMVTRVPSDRARTNWAQGIAVVEIVEPSGSRPGFHAVEQIALHEGGWAQFRGKTYESRSDGEAAA